MIRAMLRVEWWLRPSDQNVLNILATSRQPFVDVVVSEISPRVELHRSELQGNSSPHFLSHCYIQSEVLRFLDRLVHAIPDHLSLRVRRDDEFWRYVIWVACW